jgi:hypothetical protein
MHIDRVLARIALGYLFSILMLLGCATTGGIEHVRPCEVRLVTADLTDLPADSVLIQITVETRNPNAFPVDLVRLDGVVLAGETRLVSISMIGPLSIAASGRTRLSTTYRLSAAEMSADALAAARLSPLALGVEGRLFIAADEREYSFRIQARL